MPKEPTVVDIEPVPRGPVRPILLLLFLAVLAAGLWVTYDRTRTMSRPASAEAVDVRSTVYPEGDSLEVAVSWVLSADSGQFVPESVRVEVGLQDGPDASVSTQSSDRTTDTLRVTAPEPGQTASGYSCVTPIHRGQLRREACTPWQFVVPAADTAPTGAARDTADSGPGRRTAGARAPRVTRIVVQPGGLQVDPDVEGKCARWQRQYPSRSVWVEVNREAVPECTGPNGKPTVAQFCAFAVLDDGSRVMTENSSNNRYCSRLFREWASERVS